MIKSIILIIFILFIVGCTSNQEINDEKFYKLRMKIDNMGRVRYGIGVFEDKPLYTIEFTSLGKMDYFSFNSCSTNISRVNAGGLIFKRKTTKVNWKRNEIESKNHCDVTINTTEKTNHRHTSGYMVFKNPLFKLESELICGEKIKKFDGVSVCQNLEGNINKIKFDEKVKMFSINCPINNLVSSEFEFETQLGFCVYTFKGMTSKKEHRMVVYGYNDDLLL